MTTVTICLPTYEPSPQLLRRTIESVLAQTHADWTLVIHDDASTEDVHAIVAPFLADPRIRWIRSETRHGIGGNWNAAFQASKSNAPFVAYIFQDDLWDPEYLARAIAAFNNHPSAGIVALAHAHDVDPLHPHASLYHLVQAEQRHHFAKGFVKGRDFLIGWIRQGLRPNIVGEPCFVVWRRELLEQTPWGESMVQYLDAASWVQALEKADIAFVQENSGTFLVHSGGASSAHQRKWKGLLDRLKILMRLSRSGDAQIRKAARGAIVRELPKMIAKFLRRFFVR